MEEVVLREIFSPTWKVAIDEAGKRERKEVWDNN